MGHTNEDVQQSDGEGNDMASSHDKIGPLDGSPTHQDAVADKNLADVLDNDYRATNSPGSEGSLANGVKENAREDKEASAVESETDVKAGRKESSDEVTNTGSVLPENSNTEGLSKGELGRLAASRWTGENPGKQSTEVDATIHKADKDHEDLPKETDHEDDEGYASETDDERRRYDDIDVEDEVDDDFQEEEHDDLSSSYKSDTDTAPYLSDDGAANNPSWLEKIQKTVRNIFQAVNLFQTPVNQSNAARVRKEYDESSTKLSKLQSRIYTLREKLKRDFGPEMEFYSFYDCCFESKQNKYTYKVCPFKEASPEEDYSNTRLGRWDKFEDSYRVMVFSNGDKCWNGPDRSLKARLKCGLKNEIIDVDEPSVASMQLYCLPQPFAKRKSLRDSCYCMITSSVLTIE